jgi:hypothetical protein
VLRTGEHLFGHKQRAIILGAFAFSISGGEAFRSVGLLHEATEGRRAHPRKTAR